MARRTRIAQEDSLRQREIRRHQDLLKRCVSSEKQFNLIRRVLLAGLASGQTTEEGQSQHEKLELMEKAIRDNLEVKQDLEVIIATLQGEAQTQCWINNIFDEIYIDWFNYCFIFT